MDISPTQSLTSARIIPSKFGAIYNSVYDEYNPAALNAFRAVISETLAVGYPTSPGYLWATLAAHNATAPCASISLPTTRAPPMGAVCLLLRLEGLLRRGLDTDHSRIIQLQNHPKCYHRVH